MKRDESEDAAMMLVKKTSEQKTHWNGQGSQNALDLLAKRNRLSWDADADAQRTNYGQGSYRSPLLSKEEERLLFERMDELRVRIAELRVMAADLQCDLSARDLKEAEREVELIRNHIVESNLRLVVSLASKLRSPGTTEFHDLISEGNTILMKAVDLFKVKFGYRFSTYATTALKRGLYNHCNSDYRRKTRFVNGHPERFDSIEDSCSELMVCIDTLNDINAALKILDQRERKVVTDKFGLKKGAKGKTYREIGEEFDLSKERIRQIVRGALEKMKDKLAERAP